MMHHNIKHIFYFLVLFLLWNSSVAQYESRGKQFDYADAEYFFDTRNYYDALPLYQKLMEGYPKVIEYQLKIGICYLYLVKEPERALFHLNAVYERDANTTDILYYIARSYALDYQFDRAINTFKEAMLSGSTSAKTKKEIPRLIEQCENGKVIMQDTIAVEVTNLGPVINTVDNEYCPIIDADETVLIYTYRGAKSASGRQDEFNQPYVAGNYYEDIYVSSFRNGSWTEPISVDGEEQFHRNPMGIEEEGESQGNSTITIYEDKGAGKKKSKKKSDLEELNLEAARSENNINSSKHEASVSMSPDGHALFIYKDTEMCSGEIYLSKKESGKWTTPEWVNINSDDWEGSATISPNGQVIIFSSDRAGGIGGRDLYISYWEKAGYWSEPKNLGPTINTIYDDDAPFVHPDGKTFNFCSKGHNSIGGYDIFESKMLDSSYAAPRNMGYPINTTADDMFFSVSGRGNAYCSSARSGGYGQQDLYKINVKEVMGSEPVVLAKGIVKANGKFAKAKITVKTEVGKDHGQYYSDESDGKYQFYVNVDEAYVLTYDIDGYPSRTKIMDAKDINEYTEIDQDIDFATDEYIEKMTKGDPLAMPDMIEKYGKKRFDGVSFKVQIGAYTNPENYDTSYLKYLGKCEYDLLEDGITRITIGNFETLKEAYNLKEYIVDKGQEDSFIVVFVDGKRSYLQDLSKIVNKTIQQ